MGASTAMHACGLKALIQLRRFCQTTPDAGRQQQKQDASRRQHDAVRMNKRRLRRFKQALRRYGGQRLRQLNRLADGGRRLLRRRASIPPGRTIDEV
jgi:hypothetical protein